MESLLMSIALKYGKGKLTDVGLNYAAKLLGIDQQQNPKYTYGMPFTDGNISLNPINFLKRSALNTGVKSLISGGSAIAPLALGAGAIYFLNKNRKKFTGYDTQQAYEDARTERIANKRLDKITDRIVDGKNYGNYEEALLDSGAGAVKIDDVIMHGADYFPEPTPTPKKKTYTQPNIHSDNNNNNNSSGNFASQNTGTNENFSNKTGRGRTGYVRGGIASL
jgi:hypothetical protein